MIERVSRTIPSRKRRAPQATSADGDQGPTGPVSKGQRPRVRVQKASVKRASTLQQPASLRAVNWRQGKAIANEKPVKLLGPSVAPVVLFVLVVSPREWSPRGRRKPYGNACADDAISQLPALDTQMPDQFLAPSQWKMAPCCRLSSAGSWPDRWSPSVPCRRRAPSHPPFLQAEVSGRLFSRELTGLIA